MVYMDCGMLQHIERPLAQGFPKYLNSRWIIELHTDIKMPPSTFPACVRLGSDLSSELKNSWKSIICHQLVYCGPVYQLLNFTSSLSVGLLAFTLEANIFL